MRPTMGCIVIYRCGGQKYPAIVIFANGLVCGLGVFSVTGYSSARNVPYQEGPHVGSGDSWTWPERTASETAAKRAPEQKPRQADCTVCGGTGEVREENLMDPKFDEMVSCPHCEDEDR